MKFRLALGGLALSLLMSFSVLAQEEAAESKRENGKKEEKIKPYEEVISSEAVTDEGLFLIHRVNKKVFYEIPTVEMGRDLLWVSRIARTNLGVGYGGQKIDTRVVRWGKAGDRILLYDINYSVVPDTELPISQAVSASNNATIIMAFDIMAVGPKDAPVIDVTPLFESEVPEFSARGALQARGFDKSRSFIEQTLSFPDNIEVRTNHTFTRPEDNGSGSRNEPAGPRSRRGMQPGSATILMHYSMIRLPEKPMMPRLYDPRVGYFSLTQTDYGRSEHKAVERRYITRWRLEKQDQEANLSDPIKPIIYWIDPATPEQWRSYVKRGVEKWQKAFEAAGFSNAIIAKQGPTPDEDPEWHPEDARYSVIRWLPSTIENAMGPHVHDPRSGEILESDIHFYHNVQNLLRSWYFLQVAPLDPRAQTFPFPDELMGELIEYVVAHEVGHTLGFQHNMKASSLYPIEKVRDAEWVKTMSHTPTMMDYSRFNYVAQPEDGIAVADLIPKIGPYDVWATMWGYRPIPSATTPDEELPTLNEWSLQQDQTPWLQFSTAGSSGSDPGELTEAVGDADAVEATRLGLRNLEHVSAMLLQVSLVEGKPWDDLEELYGRLLGQWVREMNHVATIVGGFNSRQRHGGQKGVRFEVVPATRQKAAVAFLNENAFHVPAFMIKPDILRRIEPVGVIDRISNSQRSVLNSLLRPDRFKRLVEQAAIDGDLAYSPQAFLEDLRKGIWTEIYRSDVQIDPFRRSLQRTFLEIADAHLNGSNAVTDDMRAFLRGTLTELGADVARVTSQAADASSRYHLADVALEIGRILDPRAERSGATAPDGGRRGLVPGDEPLENCWPDLVIRPE